MEIIRVTRSYVMRSDRSDSRSRLLKSLTAQWHMIPWVYLFFRLLIFPEAPCVFRADFRTRLLHSRLTSKGAKKVENRFSSLRAFDFAQLFLFFSQKKFCFEFFCFAQKKNFAPAALSDGQMCLTAKWHMIPWVYFFFGLLKSLTTYEVWVY